ncbi:MULTISPECIES: fluoride efflux transporter CrcB [unclassified Bacillus (in: firmicutes)]|uniref:fluoride efflux transporter CrcB n=1 Tax=unclassified Bacillus (in: firmicutes) TaxID=185979 RepID=UPI001BEB416B|nr:MULTISPECIES: fluoride efflux transporter CrcB [unclassified Bacillus (in: firmicutes)]MBT2618995.1 fluoride efflux transporter CrcB [Bacillus sp. ISL-78]MBT2630657.1 fluoride efflux transporter CrcB [Bacillus sp. ISL-101]
MIWLIGIGGSLGAAARFLLGSFINNRAKKIHPFPLGTWVINITGSFFLGVIANLHLNSQISDWVWFFGGIGFCGAYTTFSTFGYETITLIQSNKIKLAIGYVTSSVIIGAVSATIGLII